MGENVGVEISGKGAYFTRPVIIFKKLDAFSFIGIALTKTDRSGDRYEKIIISGVTNTVLLAHIHNYDYRRLDKQITILSESDFEMIRQAFIKFISE